MATSPRGSERLTVWALPFHLARPQTIWDVQLVSRLCRTGRQTGAAERSKMCSFMSHSPRRSSFSRARFALRRSQSSRHTLTVAWQTRVPGPVCRRAGMTQLSLDTVLLQMEAIMAPRKYFWKNDSVLTAGAAGCNHSVIEVLWNISAMSIPRRCRDKSGLRAPLWQA